MLFVELLSFISCSICTLVGVSFEEFFFILPLVNRPELGNQIGIYICVCMYVCIMYLFIYITDFDFLWFPNHPIQDLQDQAQPSKYIEVIGLMSPPTCVGIGSWGMVAKCCEILRLLVDGLSHCNSIISMGISGS